MPDYCSCGAELPADAVFCHKCGKPQRAIGAVEPEVASVPALPAAPVQIEPSPLNFNNPVALRIAILVALGATFLSFLPYLNWLAAGYFAVWFYRRRTGYRLNISAGLRMGWITGVVMFAIVAVILAGSAIVINAAGGLDAVQLQFKNMADPRVQEMLKILRNGPDIAILLMQLFVFITCLSMAGGALGAKLAGNR